MTLYSYRARNSEGKLIRGVLLADTPRQARDQLRDQSLKIILVEASSATRHGMPSILRTRHRYQSTIFFRELSTLLSVGIPLVEALDILISQLRGRFRSLVQQLRESIANGQGFAKALSAYPHVFDSFALSMAEVGENAGTLETNLSQLADFRESREQMKDRVLSSLLYPAIVAMITCGVTIFLMTAVVPTLLQNLIEMGRPLPWPTRILKSVSDLLLNQGLLILAATVATGILSILFLRTKAGWIWFHRTLLLIPVFGTLVRKQNCGRISLFIGTLVQSGLDPLKAFEIASQAVANPLYRQALTAAAQAIASGREFRQAFAPHESLFPATVVQLFALGQNSGQLDTMLLRLGEGSGS